MKPSALLIQGATVYGPEPLGHPDVLVVEDRIVAVGEKLSLPLWAQGVVIEGHGHLLVPGLIDLHVHIAGGGGEGGPIFRTPEILLSQLTLAGITTVVGVLGTDGTTRSVAGLLAKARALEQEGISAWIYTGAYQVPLRTITDSPRADLILVDRVIGIGEVAISDFRGSHPNVDELARLAAEARVGGLLADKAGILHLHVGDGSGALRPIFDVLEVADVPIDTFLPTHLNRNRHLLTDGLRFAQAGGQVDITSGIYPEPGDTGAVDPGQAISEYLSAGVALQQITLSSDAQGSSPIFDAKGHLLRMGIGTTATLWATVVRLHRHFGLPWETALAPATANPAAVLKLSGVGHICSGGQADLLLVDEQTQKIETVMARGKILVDAGRARVRGPYAQHEGGRSG